jgi:hypothetical protein
MKDAIKRLELEFTAACLEGCARTVRETNGAYHPTEFRRMVVERGGRVTVKDLIHGRKIHDGFLRLAELRRWDLTCEWEVVHNRHWDPLFTNEDRRVARFRLRQLTEGR